VLPTDGGDHLATGLERSNPVPAKSQFVGLMFGGDRFGEVGHGIGHLLLLGDNGATDLYRCDLHRNRQPPRILDRWRLELIG